MFGCCESDLDDLYWRYSFFELKKRIELKVGYTTASHMAQYSSFIEVASAALGGGDKKPKITEDLSGATPEHFMARIASIGSV